MYRSASGALVARISFVSQWIFLPERYAKRSDDHFVLREMTDEVMFEIQSITGQQYRNVYASKRQDDQSPLSELQRVPVATGK